LVALPGTPRRGRPTSGKKKSAEERPWEEHFARFKSNAHPKAMPHLDFHEALMKGDLSFVERKLNSLNERMQQDVRHGRARVLEQTSQNKLDKCNLLVSCAKEMSVYDLFVFFYADDIRFDNGEIDKDIQNSDAFSIDNKRSRILVALNAATAFLASQPNDSPDEVDGCDLLLEEFHRNVEQDIPLPVRWVGLSVIDVCRARGATQYVSFSGLEAANLNKVSDFFFEDIVLCARTLHDNKPTDLAWQDEKFVFVREFVKEFNDGSRTLRVLRVPSGVKGGRDVHGRFTTLDMDEFFEFEEIGK
jgi:hypothetical protein